MAKKELVRHQGLAVAQFFLIQHPQRLVKPPLKVGVVEQSAVYLKLVRVRAGKRVDREDVHPAKQQQEDHVPHLMGKQDYVVNLPQHLTEPALVEKRVLILYDAREQLLVQLTEEHCKIAH